MFKTVFHGPERFLIVPAILFVLVTVAGCHEPTAGYGNLEGMVTGPDGIGIAGVSVIYGDSSVVTDQSGYYRYDNIPDGTQGFRFELRGYYPVMELVNIPAGSTAACDVVIDIIRAGWAAGTEDSGYGTILGSTDAGRSWVRQGSPATVPSARLTDVCALSDRSCWIAGDADTVRGTTVILRTDDGGTTWINQGASITSIPPVSVAGIISMDGDTAWAAASDTGLVLKTVNAGKSWSVCRTSEYAAGYTAVTTPDGINLWCCGVSAEGYAVLEYSPDGGVTWSVTDITSMTGLSGIPSDVCAVSETSVYLTGTGAMGLLVIMDGGSRWVQHLAGMELLSLDVLDIDRVWASGTGGHLVGTADGFIASEDLLPAEGSFPGGSVTSVAFLRDGVSGAFTVKSQTGATGSVFYTVDSGATWSQSSLPFSFSLESVDFVGRNN